MFWSLFTFELRYQSRQLSWWFAVVMLFVLGCVLSGRQLYHVNVMALSPHNITYGLAFLCKISLFTTSVFAANAALRDRHFDFHAFIQTKPVSNSVLIMSRFSSLFVISLVPILCAILGMLLPSLIIGHDPDIDGTFALINILWPLLVIVLPNMLFISSILYVCATLFQSSIITFVAGVSIYILYILASAMLDSPLLVTSAPLARDEINLASLLDPFALAPFLAQAQSLTTQALNTHLLTLEGDFLFNRLLWLMLSLVILISAIHTGRYRGEQQTRNSKKNHQSATQNDAQKVKLKPKYQPTAIVFKGLLALKASVILELTMIIKSRSFALLLLLVSGLVITLVINGLYHNALVGEQLPFTSILMSYIQPPLEMVGVFMTIFFSGEIVWRARENRFSEVLAVTSAPSLIHFFSHIIVMICLLTIVIGLLILLVIGYQWMVGFYADDVSLMLFLFPLCGLPLLLTAILGLSVQSVVNNKYTGYFIVGSIVLFYQSDIANMLGVNHHLLRFADTGPRFFSDFNGYDFYLTGTFWFSLYWLLVTAFIAIVAYTMSKRSIDESVLTAARRLPSLAGVNGRRLAVVVFISILLNGSYIFYNTNVINHYHTADDQLQLQLHYEKQLQQYKYLPAPKIVDMDLDVAFYPSQYKVTISGNYHLINSHTESISQFLVTLPQREQSFQLTLTEGHKSKVNRALNVIEIILEQPLLANQELQLSFATSIQKQGFKNADHDISLASNGSYFHSSYLLPYIGYDGGNEISDAKARSSHKLAKRQYLPKLIAGQKYHKHSYDSDASWINFRARVSTEEGQTPIANGMLQDSWVENGRVYADYNVDHKIMNFLGFASANYHTKSLKVGRTTINAYFHPAHNVNIDHMLSVAAQSLRYFESIFGPYQLPELNLVEIPNRAFARAYPGTIFISEHVGYKEDLSPGTGVDNIAHLIAHEIAHMWWGHQLTAAKTEGEVLLIESVAEYSAWMMMKERYGEAYVDHLISSSTTQYFNNRSLDERGETSLYKIIGQRYLRYQKGPLILNGIRHLVGEDALHDAFKQLLQEKGSVAEDYATSLDLIAVIKQKATPTAHSLIDEWLTEIITYDLSINQASVRKLAGGEYQVSAELEGIQWLHNDAQGATQQAFQHTVKLALYDEAEKPIKVSQPSLKLDNGRQQVIFTVAEKPAFLVLDPRSMFIDKNRIDNRIRLQTITPSI